MFDDQQAYDRFLAPGTRLSKYEIARGLAVGGMAELYLARTTGVQGFRRLVALKRILPHYAASPDFSSMFVDEARLVARLEHPNIAQVFDIGRDPLGLFFTMEYVHGPDVRRILQNAQKSGQDVPIEHAVAIVSAAARGLHAAHEKRGRDGRSLGIVHRDVSPSNMLVSFDGVVKLIDFGVAKARLRTHKTRDGTIKGKVSYMSPEQGRGDELDHRSDIFSLGIVLWELTTTRKLYYGSNDFAILRQIVHKNPPRPSWLVPGYPAPLEAIVMRALSRNIGKRYQSARELADDLDQFASTMRYSSSPAELGAYVAAAFPSALAVGQQLSEWCECVPSGALARHLALGGQGDACNANRESAEHHRESPEPAQEGEQAEKRTQGDADKQAGTEQAIEVAAGPDDSCAAPERPEAHVAPDGRPVRHPMRHWLAGLAGAALLTLAGLGATIQLGHEKGEQSRILDSIPARHRPVRTPAGLSSAASSLGRHLSSGKSRTVATDSGEQSYQSEDVRASTGQTTPDDRSGEVDRDENRASSARRRAYRRRRSGRGTREGTMILDDPAATTSRESWDPDSALPPTSRRSTRSARTP